ncbi:hypothetical protein WT67_08275 [Burkholderia stagnalis]|nr:hypothetical protein WT29_09375 [Burkholderia stagnalis]KWH87636.1 hypothetical protein WT69_25945 [Burkholderia stagnalis]KWH94834.1 hypothetical protein WT68_11575 [Burkholderia stagnalis]KWH95806.1 hypothetical protein WT67_08275 [Burkholderia stagnalis]KWI08807.1 hypothetical protein WT70_20885 [Burkholderia stagnalis]
MLQYLGVRIAPCILQGHDKGRHTELKSGFAANVILLGKIEQYAHQVIFSPMRKGDANDFGGIFQKAGIVGGGYPQESIQQAVLPAPVGYGPTKGAIKRRSSRLSR